METGGFFIMTTYREIQDYARKKYGITIKPCWIADVKELCGLNPKIALNRSSLLKRKNPCPRKKVAIVKEAFKYFGMI